MTGAGSALFRFSPSTHAYIDLATGEELPFITGMLKQTGWVDDTWFTEESSERGREVHRLTADYDLGALDVARCISYHRGYLLAHVAAMSIIQPRILAVEEPAVHPVLKFGGRPDRLVELHGFQSVLEIKSGAPHKSHPIQTALQAILSSVTLALPPEQIGRFVLYLRPTGKFKLEQCKDRRDIDEAQRIVRECCR